MNIEKNQIVLLDNNENYFVANVQNYNEKIYAMLINVNKENDYMLVKKINESFFELIKDEDELTIASFILLNNIN